MRGGSSQSLPSDITRGLNGGVYLLPDIKHNDRIPSSDYYVMGEYCVCPAMGRSIFLYYGSFMALYVDAGVEEMEAQLRHTVLHEFRHHVEGLAGDRSLEIEDERIVIGAHAALKRRSQNTFEWCIRSK